MKKFLLLYTYVLFHITALNAQHDVIIRVEDPFSFRPVPNAYVLLNNSEKQYYYKTGPDGTLKISWSGPVEVSVTASRYQTLTARFDVTGRMEIGFLLDPEQDYVPEHKQDVYLEAYIFDKETYAPVPQGKITVYANEFRFTVRFSDGKFILDRSNAPGWWTALPEETEVTYVIETPTHTDYLETDLIPQVYTVKDFRLSTSPGHLKKNFPYSEQVKQIPDDIRKKLHRSSPQSNLQTACDRLPNTIRVGTNCNCNDCTSVMTMTLQTYVKKGLNDEWIASWHMESLKAGSLPYRTYGAYYVYHPIDPNYDIANTTCKQVWDSDYSTRCYTAADATLGEYLETAGGAIAFSEYSAENNCLNPSSSYPCNCGDGYSGNGTDWPCIQDAVCAGHDRYGHGRGMCQWGSSRWANNGRNYQWIANHYYNPGHIYRCGTNHPHPDFAVSNPAANPTQATPGTSVSASCMIQNPTSYKTDKSLIKLFLSADTQFDTSDIPLDTLTLWPLQPGGSITKYFDFQVPNVANGNYHLLFVADPDGLMYESDETNNVAVMSFTVGTTAIEENELSRNLAVYPNPASDHVIASIQNNMTLKKIRITDLTGRVIRDISNFPVNSRKQVRIDVQYLRPGMYQFIFEENHGLRAVYKILIR